MSDGRCVAFDRHENPPNECCGCHYECGEYREAPVHNDPNHPKFHEFVEVCQSCQKVVDADQYGLHGHELEVEPHVIELHATITRVTLALRASEERNRSIVARDMELRAEMEYYKNGVDHLVNHCEQVKIAPPNALCVTITRAQQKPDRNLWYFNPLWYAHPLVPERQRTEVPSAIFAPAFFNPAVGSDDRSVTIPRDSLDEILRITAHSTADEAHRRDGSCGYCTIRDIIDRALNPASRSTNKMGDGEKKQP